MIDLAKVEVKVFGLCQISRQIEGVILALCLRTPRQGPLFRSKYVFLSDNIRFSKFFFAVFLLLNVVTGAKLTYAYVTDCTLIYFYTTTSPVLAPRIAFVPAGD